MKNIIILSVLSIFILIGIANMQKEPDQFELFCREGSMYKINKKTGEVWYFSDYFHRWDRR